MEYAELILVNKQMELIQTTQTLTQRIDRKFDLAKVPYAKGAAFDSHTDELDARCHPQTRVELRQQIQEWVEDPHGKSIFWLNGMAGTGKSTLSRTIAQECAERGQLAASLFFKRGEGDRATAARFFLTIARQLATKIPSLSKLVADAISGDPIIAEKSLKQQFDELVYNPLSTIHSDELRAKRVVIIIDALDECEREGDAKNILLLLSQLRQLTSIRIRTFVTSRPQLHIRLGFIQLQSAAY
ncbi:hypothetical protein MMC25_004614 [Agyrium rufum]|nr:hypothetical protein [Agyrium rufum]